MKNVLIVGVARSGKAMASLCLQKNIKYSLFDSKIIDENLQICKNARKIYNLNNKDELFADIEKFDCICLSPAISLDTDFVKLASEKEIEIIGELELAYRFSNSKNFILISGTNGKTTTTTITYEILKKVFYDVRVVGNIGNPMCLEVLNDTKDTIYVVEISSYQLETVKDFKAKITALTNITPDHLDRHKTFENYKNLKFKLYEITENNENFIINLNDAILKDEILKNKKYEKCKKIISFNENEKVEKNLKEFLFKNNVFCYKKEDIFYYLENGNFNKLLTTNELLIFGEHNYQNILIVIVIAKILNINDEIIINTLKQFKGVEHRIEFVRCINSTNYYNDSKATNPESAIVALKSMKKKVILICGGSDKKSDFSEFVSYFYKKVEFVILCGDTKFDIEKELLKQNYKNYKICDNLKESLYLAKKLSNENLDVLFSPACASFDYYKSYEHRGQYFKELCNKL